ncbi:hypothetical protein ACIQOU_33840 [Streptomyces sp. NPDC091279]|uniref:hypothetical protein n=1 Tax=Streptomyces sp. NPDC091279 TaxID=3365983 RepID=UPI00380FF615
MGFVVVLLVVAIVGGALVMSNRRRDEARAQAGAGYDADVGAEAWRWVERLSGSLSTLDAGDNRAAAQALADASERRRAAEGQLAGAVTPAQFALVTQTAVEGLHYVRAARTALGLDPGPALPAVGVNGQVAGQVGADGQVTVDGQTYTASARPGAANPYYYPGGVVGGRSVPGGWYSSPWWKTALVAGAAGVGGMLLADALFDGFHHHGPGGGPGGFGGFGGPGGPGGPGGF